MFSIEKKYKNLILIVAVFLLCLRYWDSVMQMLGVGFQAAVPLMVGGMIAYVLNILMVFYEKYYPVKVGKVNTGKVRRPVCIILSLVSFVLIVLFVCVLIIPELVNCIKLLVQEIPEMWDVIQSRLQDDPEILDYLNQLGEKMDFNPSDMEGMVAKAASLLGAGLGGAMNTLVSVVSSVFSTIVTILVALVFAIYLLACKEKLADGADRILRAYLSKWYEKIYYVLRVVHQSFHSFIVGQCVEAVILGVLCIVGMLIFRFPYATMVGTLIGFTALIPVAGAYVGGGVGAFMICSVSPVKAVLFVVFLVVLQQLEGNLIYPKVVGSSIGLPGIWVLAAVTVGGGIMGIAGMLLGVPLVAALYQLLQNDLQKKVPVHSGKQNPLEQRELKKKELKE
ncbi:MAG: AI-2E family transporter [Lachnospiraceae bacterium]|nr:AI-2E family transporter [Lachnospiraceae bacterium]